MANIFCGIGNVPKGSRRGGMKECLEKKQVRYWGSKKIDPRTIAGHLRKDTIKETRDQLVLQHISAKGSINRLSGRVKEIERKIANKKATDEDKKKLPGYKKELAAAERILKLAGEKLKIVTARNQALKTKDAAAQKKAATQIIKTKKAMNLTPAEALKKTTIKQRRSVISKAIKEDNRGKKKRAPLRTSFVKKAPVKSTKGVVRKPGTKKKKTKA